MMVLRQIGVFAAYVVLARLGLYMATIHSSASPVWPATGLAIAAAFVYGRQVWPAIALAAAVANGLSGSPILLCLIIAIGNTLEAILGAFIIRRLRSMDKLFSFQSQTLAFVLSSSLSPIVSATVGIFALIVTGKIGHSAGELKPVWFTWWLGDAVGSLLVAPLAIGAFESRLRNRTGFLALTVLISIVSVWLFGINETPALAMAIFPFLLLATYFGGEICGRWTSFIVSVVAVYATLQGRGIFTAGPLNTNLINLQFFIATVLLTVLMLEGFKKVVSIRLPAMLLLLGWGLSGLLLDSIHREETAKDAKKFARLMEDVKKAIDLRFTNYVDALVAGRALYAASNDVTPQEWDTFISSTNVAGKYPGIRALGVVWPIQMSSVVPFQRNVLWRYDKNAKVHQVPGHSLSSDEGFIISLLSPRSSNEAAIGLDVGSEENRRRAAELARDSGQPAITEKIQLVQAQNEAAFLLFVPMYWKQNIWPTQEERRKHFRGWIYAAFVTKDFLFKGVGAASREIDFAVYDGDRTEASSLIYYEADVDVQRAAVSKMELGQRTLTFAFQKSPEFVSSVDSRAANAGFIGAILNILLVTIIVGLQSIKVQAQALAKNKTEELSIQNEKLQRAQEQYELVVDGSHDGFWDWDLPTGKVYFSERWKSMLGYGNDEIRSHYETWRDLLHPEDMEQVLGQLDDYLKHRRPNYEVECRMRHKDGSYRWILSRGAAFWDESGKPYRMAGSHKDITVRKQTEHELILAKESALAANQAKSQFLANMSHEIRTPLNGIIGTIGLLRDTRLNADQLDLVEVVNQSADTLLTVISDVLDFSKIEAGKLEVESVNFDLKEQVSTAMKIHNPAARDRSLELILNFAARKPCWVEGDLTKIRQIINNLVSNAIKFTPKGSVSVSVEEPSKNEFLFKVKDTGVGIPEQALHRIFEAFSQADNSTTRRFGGTGLGLSICKHLVQLMGGTIGVESTPASGSTFWFRLPLQRREPDLNPATVPTLSELTATEGARVLVAEDNLINQRVVLSILSKLGYRAVGVANGYEALDALRANDFDVVLMDCQMPELDGYEATEKIRTSKTLRNWQIPIVAMTASAVKGDRERCLSIGMNDYVTKPVKPETLVQVIEKWIPVRSKVINMKTLEELAGSVEGGGEMVRKVKQVYLHQLPVQVDSIRHLAIQGNVVDCQKMAHSLKTSSYTLGLERMGDSALAVESWRADGDVALLDLIDRLASEADSAQSALNAA